MHKHLDAVRLLVRELQDLGKAEARRHDRGVFSEQRPLYRCGRILFSGDLVATPIGRRAVLTLSVLLRVSGEVYCHLVNAQLTARGQGETKLALFSQARDRFGCFSTDVAWRSDWKCWFVSGDEQS